MIRILRTILKIDSQLGKNASQTAMRTRLIRALIANVKSDIIEDMDVILIVQKFAQYFSSVFTIDDNVDLPKVENLPCIYPFNEFVVTEKWCYIS